MASKLHNFFQQGKKSAAKELQSPSPPLKRMGIFLSFEKDGHSHIGMRVERVTPEL